MRVIEFADQSELTFRQRWGSYLAIFVVVAGVLAGFLYRSNIVNATFPFVKPEVGITARYPANWLLEEGPTPIVFRATDPSASPFKTTLQVQLVPTGPGTTAAYILNQLDMDRSARLPAYRSLDRQPVVLTGAQRGTQMIYAYAAVGANPFLQDEPVTVRAIDLVVLRPGQAIVISYQADAASFEKNRHYFDDFLRSLSF